MAAAVLVAAFFMPANARAYVDSPDTVAIQGILQEHHSPLPWWTVAAFKASHSDFDVAGYLAVMEAESSMGRTGGSARYCNPGNIKFCGWRAPDDPKVWLRWQCGSWYCKGQGYYGRYPTMYWGQRAAIRLIYDAGYNRQLAAHDWDGFSKRYYGTNVKGRSSYIADLRAAHNRIVQEARAYGVAW